MGAKGRKEGQIERASTKIYRLGLAFDRDWCPAISVFNDVGSSENGARN